MHKYIFSDSNTHPFHTQQRSLEGFFPPFFDKWFLPVSVGLWIGIISKITLGREPQSWIWESFDCLSRKKNVSQQWKKNASCIKKKKKFRFHFLGGFLKNLCIPVLGFLVFSIFPCLFVYMYRVWRLPICHLNHSTPAHHHPISPSRDPSITSIQF